MPNNNHFSTINREISWLHFNGRVLQEANDPQNPLIERIKFLGIYSNNRDEFFSVRVATLKRLQKLYNKFEHKKPKFKPKKILLKINQIIEQQEKEFTACFHKILKELENENIFMLDEKKLNVNQGDYVRKYFHSNIRPHLFPLILSSNSNLTTLKDRSIYLAIVLSDSSNIKPEQYALVQLPTDKISRFFILPEHDGKMAFLMLDDVVRYCLKDIFSTLGYDKYHAYTVKFTRDAELDIDSDISKSFLETMQESIKQRKRGLPVRFVYDEKIPKNLLENLIRKFGIKQNDTLRKGGRYHNFKDFMNFPEIGPAHLKFKKLPPLSHKEFQRGKSILNTIREKDILLHFPYQSFQYIIDLLREASIDPSVKSIRMTLYRAAKDSKVINALINAARNGKSVTVFLELQARFDEEANIEWSQMLQDEGVNIIKTIPGIKVHCKLILIRRKENNENVYYGNISTGNYNESTAKIYADESLLTSNKNITRDIRKIFELFESRFTPPSFRKIMVSPFAIRDFIISKINQEIQNKKEKKEAWIILKMNSLVDQKIIRKLYEASNEGIKIKLIVRGICVLIPQIEGQSENIEVISILDRYLEHSRVFIFANNGNKEFFISSADLMKRNLDHRIEICTPINDTELKKELWDIINLQLKDNMKAREISIHPPNKYKTSESQVLLRSQLEIYRYFERILTNKY
ncbi:MAG: polyphosphate kinase 1 [Bacteroidales bacterium]